LGDLGDGESDFGDCWDDNEDDGDGGQW
jgi:hypothetical protein